MHRCFKSLSRSFSSSSLHNNVNTTPVIAFDIDGVLIRGKTIIPRAAEAIQKITPKHLGGSLSNNSVSIPYIFLTNGGGCMESVKSAQLSQWFGVKISPNQVCLSHSPAIELLPKYKEKRVLILGYTDVVGVAKNYGFKHALSPMDLAEKYPQMVPLAKIHELHPTTDNKPSINKNPIPESISSESSERTDLESISAILVFHDPYHWYEDCQICMDILTLNPNKPQIPVYFSNPDFLFSGKHWKPRLAAGAFKLCLESLYHQYTGKKLISTVFGKPSATTYRWAEKLLIEQTKAIKPGFTISKAYMIGDNIFADIAGANTATQAKDSHLGGINKWKSILVKSGTIEHTSNDPIHHPHYTVKDVNEAIQLIIDQEFK